MPHLTIHDNGTEVQMPGCHSSQELNDEIVAREERAKAEDVNVYTYTIQVNNGLIEDNKSPYPELCLALSDKGQNRQDIDHTSWTTGEHFGVHWPISNLRIDNVTDVADGFEVKNPDILGSVAHKCKKDPLLCISLDILPSQYQERVQPESGNIPKLDEQMKRSFTTAILCGQAQSPISAAHLVPCAINRH
ncbi:hypothetical protein MMC28_006215 [Mycoblastus sanguinarius]|nr:hypothetical protein [Mycoblastus sanguinarius]